MNLRQRWKLARSTGTLPNVGCWGRESSGSSITSFVASETINPKRMKRKTKAFLKMVTLELFAGGMALLVVIGFLKLIIAAACPGEGAFC